MKIELIEPSVKKPGTQNRIRKISGLLNLLGYDVIEQASGRELFRALVDDHPDVAFNLDCIYGEGKTNLVPAVFEIAGVSYTGSGMLGLSLAMNYSKLMPLLQKSGVMLPHFRVLRAEALRESEALPYPYHLYRDGEKTPAWIQRDAELVKALQKMDAGEEVVIMGSVSGGKTSQYLLDGSPIPEKAPEPLAAAAKQVYAILEARGLARFDFVTDRSGYILVGFDLSPDPMDETLNPVIAEQGWDTKMLLKTLVEHAGRDIS